MTRGSSGFGPSPLAHRDIACWARLMRIEIEPWEVRALIRLDLLWRHQYAEANAPKKKDAGSFDDDWEEIPAAAAAAAKGRRNRTLQ